MLDRLHAQVSRLAVEEPLGAIGGQCGVARPLSAIIVREGVGLAKGAGDDFDSERTTFASNPKTAATRFIVRSVSLSPERFSSRETADCGIPANSARRPWVIRAFFRHSRTCWPKLIIASILLLGACADKPAPLDSAFCRLYQRLPDPADAVHLKKRENKIAILTNEQTWLHECTQNGSGLTPGPR